MTADPRYTRLMAQASARGPRLKDPYPTPPTPGQTPVIRRYKGDQRLATTLFEADAERMSRLGYHPASQVWAPGSYGVAAFVVAVLLTILLVGILILVALLMAKPPGTLLVTYELSQSAEQTTWPSAGTGPALSDRLGQLAAARNAGLISPQEFDAKRSELLAQF